MYLHVNLCYQKHVILSNNIYSNATTTITKDYSLFRNKRLYAWWNVPSKRFKIYHIFGIQKPVFFLFCATFILGEKIKYSMERIKLRGFSYSKNMANFEAFRWNISSSINLLFLKCIHNYFFLICSKAWKANRFKVDVQKVRFIRERFWALLKWKKELM